MAGTTVQRLQAAGHDVLLAGDWIPDPGDEQILAQALAEDRILVTLDSDFGELAVVRQQPHSGILRLVNFRSVDQAAVCSQILSSHGDELQSGAIITATPGRLRVRPRDSNP